MLTMLNRRDFVRAGATFASVELIRSSRAFAATYANTVEMEKWIEQWRRQRASSETLHLSRFPERMYFLLKPIGWKPEGDKIYRFPEVNVPTGFVTDFASIPQVFWSILPPDGDYTYSAILHDYLYWKQSTSREVADDIFRISMQEFGVKPSKVGVIYSAVRVGGKGPWNANAAEKRRGLKRVLIKFPDDPKIRWSIWQKKEGVFGAE